MVKAPVQVYGVEGRYATALFSAASKNNQLDKIDSEMKVLHNLYQDDAKFREFVLDPTHDRKVKRDAIVAVLKKLGQSDTSQNFFGKFFDGEFLVTFLTAHCCAGLVAENGRLPKLGAIAKSFATLMSAQRGEVQCEVCTAKV